MDLRPELLPPPLDAVRVARLAELATRLDGAQPGQWEDDLAEFNRVAGSAIPIEEFQGIYGAEDHEDWVRRLLYQQALVPADVTREEMVEIVSRAMPQNGNPNYDFYFQLFLVNCKHPSGSDLIFWPNLVAELPQDREPTAEEIADLALGQPTGRNRPPDSP